MNSVTEQARPRARGPVLALIPHPWCSRRTWANLDVQSGQPRVHQVDLDDLVKLSNLPRPQLLPLERGQRCPPPKQGYSENE